MSKNYMYKLKEFEQHKNICRISESLYNDGSGISGFFKLCLTYRAERKVMLPGQC